MTRARPTTKRAGIWKRAADRHSKKAFYGLGGSGIVNCATSASPRVLSMSLMIFSASSNPYVWKG